MKWIMFSLVFLCSNSFGNYHIKDCNLGIYENFDGYNDAMAVLAQKAKELFPSYIAQNPKICPTGPLYVNKYGSSPLGNYNGVAFYMPGANINFLGPCWDCPTYCGAGWPEFLACFVPYCPSGYTMVKGRCLNYVVTVTPDSPPISCPVGNPVDSSSGRKIQSETDIESRGDNQIGFTRHYTNQTVPRNGVWNHTYQKSLRIIDPTKTENLRAKSSPYASKELACTSGFNELKGTLTDSWAQGSSARYADGKCQVVRNNLVVKVLPVVPNVNSVELLLTPDAIHFMRDDSSALNFGSTANNQYTELNGERGELFSIANTPPTAWRYKVPNGDVEDYNAEGKLISITARNGIKQELFYDATSGLLSRVKDSTGRELVFAYKGNQLSSVTVDDNNTTSYAYNSLGLINKVTRPDNTTRIYHYEDSRFPTYLTGITDERGKRYATWKYDEFGRAISSEHAGGTEKTLLAFNADGSTTVTNPLGKKTVYRFDDIAGARRVVKVEGQPTANCAGANQDYTYTNEGWIASKTDWKGIKTTYQYNALGQEISRTEAFGTTEARTITTEWHPTFYLKTKVTEPDKETTFSRDEDGRLLNQAVRALIN